MSETARRAFTAALVFTAVVVTALALWKLKLLIVLLFFAFTVAAAMRPSVEALQRRRVPPGVGILLHYGALAAGVGLMLWAVVPRAVTQIQEALGEAESETGFKGDVLMWLNNGLERLPQGRDLFDPALELTVLGFEIALAIFFVFASAAYWIFERDDAVRLNFVIPHVLGDAVGLSPLLVIVSVAATAILFGEFAVLLAIPLAAALATLFEVVVLERNPAEQEVPAVLFPAQDAETRG